MDASLNPGLSGARVGKTLSIASSLSFHGFECLSWPSTCSHAGSSSKTAKSPSVDISETVVPNTNTGWNRGNHPRDFPVQISVNRGRPEQRRHGTTWRTETRTEDTALLWSGGKRRAHKHTPPDAENARRPTLNWELLKALRRSATQAISPRRPSAKDYPHEPQSKSADQQRAHPAPTAPDAQHSMHGSHDTRGSLPTSESPDS